ncbi:MAG: arsenic efflux protein [Bacteroidales bacterium]|nr:arsenic efflux protein [Bacteroidales bacterium]
MIHILAEVLRDSILITLLVIVMMSLIEIVNVASHGHFFTRLNSNRFTRVLFGAAMGMIPGCVGGFATVSLYSHGMITFGALVAMMIASSGDEAFVMLAMFPGKALLLFAILFVIAVAVGLLVDLRPAGKEKSVCRQSYGLHEDDLEETGHGHHHILDRHFFKEHLWHHVIKEHALSVFCWTFGALLLIHIGMEYVDLEAWMKENLALVMLLAVLIGIIPDSGPHLIFVTMFASGLIPFSVLLASSISQDGHSALPLLAENRMGFVKAKLINCIVAAVAGYALYFFGI